MNSKNKQTVTSFIDEIWNQNQFSNIDKFLHPNFIDHSLPGTLPANKEGLKLWISGTGKTFQHQTIVEEIVSEEDKVMVKIKMALKHIGKWRDIEPTGKNAFTKGYRYFKIADNKIIEHWALIDGSTIENELTDKTHGCKIQK